MPYSERLDYRSLVKFEKERSLISTKQKPEWLPKRSQIKASQQINFQKFSDEVSGGIRYWHKQKHTGSMKNYRESVGLRKEGVRVNQDKCRKCGGFYSEESKLRLFLNQTPCEPKCSFGRQYCDVIGPCAGCSLLDQRDSIVQKQNLEFPDLEVTPRSLVAPMLAQTILSQAIANERSPLELIPSGHSFLRLPTMSPDTLKYMRKEVGSPRHKRNAVQKNQTIKKYIEVRLPKI